MVDRCFKTVNSSVSENFLKFCTPTKEVLRHSKSHRGRNFYNRKFLLSLVNGQELDKKADEAIEYLNNILYLTIDVIGSC